VTANQGFKTMYMSSPL